MCSAQPPSCGRRRPEELERGADLRARCARNRVLEVVHASRGPTGRSPRRAGRRSAGRPRGPTRGSARPCRPGHRSRIAPVRADRIGERRVVVRVRQLAVVADALPDRERLLVADLHRGEVALPPADAAERLDAGEPGGAGRRATTAPRAIASSRRRASPRWPCFCQNRHIVNASPIATGGVRLGDRPVEDGPDVVVGELEPVEPAPLVVAGELRAPRARRGRRTSRDGGARIASARRAPRAARRRTRGSTRAARSAARRRRSRRPGRGSGRRAPSGRRRRRRRAPRPGPQTASAASMSARAGEDRQPVEEPAAAVVEQVVAPGDRAAQRLLALRQVARRRRPARRAGARAGRGSRRGRGA